MNNTYTFTILFLWYWGRDKMVTILGRFFTRGFLEWKLLYFDSNLTEKSRNGNKQNSFHGIYMIQLIEYDGTNSPNSQPRAIWQRWRVVISYHTHSPQNIPSKHLLHSRYFFMYVTPVTQATDRGYTPAKIFLFAFCRSDDVDDLLWPSGCLLDHGQHWYRYSSVNNWRYQASTWKDLDLYPVAPTEHIPTCIFIDNTVLAVIQTYL